MGIEFVDKNTVTPEDIDNLVELENNTFGHHGYPRYFFMQAVEIFKDSFLIARDAKNNIVGYLIASVGDDAWVLSICVDQKSQRKGVASELIEKFLMSLKNSKTRIIYAASDPANTPLINLYKKFGFSIDKLKENYHGYGYNRYILKKEIK